MGDEKSTCRGHSKCDYIFCGNLNRVSCGSFTCAGSITSVRFDGSPSHPIPSHSIPSHPTRFRTGIVQNRALESFHLLNAIANGALLKITEKTSIKEGPELTPRATKTFENEASRATKCVRPNSMTARMNVLKLRDHLPNHVIPRSPARVFRFPSD